MAYRIPLSPREKQIARLLSTGLNLPAVAKRLGIASGTARNHLASIHKKAGLHDRAQLVKWVKKTNAEPKS